MQIVSVECSSRVDQYAWDNLVARMGGGLFQSYSQVMYSASLTNSEPLFLRAIGADGECVGVAAGKADASRFWPFSRYCRRAELWSVPTSLDGDAESAAVILKGVEQELQRRGVFRVAITSFDSSNSASVLSRLGYRTGSRHEFYIDLTKSAEEIWGNLDGARRREVRKAEKLGVETRCVNSRVGLELVYQFYTQSMQRRDATVALMDRKIELGVKHFLEPKLGTVLVSYRNGVPINALFVAMFRDKSYALVSGASDEGRKSKGPVHAFWAAIKLFKEKECSTLDIGGAKEDEQGLFRFKKEFGSRIVAQPFGTKNISIVGEKLNSLRALMRRGVVPRSSRTETAASGSRTSGAM